MREILEQIKRSDAGYFERFHSRIISRIEEANKATSSAIEMGIDAGEASDIGLRVLLEEVGDIALEQYAVRERYARKVEAFDVDAVRFTDQAIGDYERTMLDFLGKQFQAVRADLEADHSWYSGFQDTGRTIGSKSKELKNWVERKLDSTTNVPGQDPKKNDWEKVSLERITENHLADTVIEEFTAKLGREIETDLQNKWSNTVKGVESDLQQSWLKLDDRSDLQGPHKFSPEMDAGSKAAIIGLGAASVGVVVLAAGWHTLAWSLGGLFLPALPVVIAASIGFAFLGKEAALKKSIEVVNDQEKAITESVKQSVRYRMHADLARFNKDYAETLKRKFFGKYIGNFEPVLLDKLIRAFEDYLDELGNVADVTVVKGHENADVHWLGRARDTLENGDELAAAMYGSLAFEQILRDINRKASLGFNFRVPHHNRAFIDRLAHSGKVTSETISNLRSLKHRRDTFIHRMHHVAAMPGGKRSRMVGRFIGDLEKAGK